jgi:hypothetical protein
MKTFYLKPESLENLTQTVTQILETEMPNLFEIGNVVLQSGCKLYEAHINHIAGILNIGRPVVFNFEYNKEIMFVIKQELTENFVRFK